MSNSDGEDDLLAVALAAGKGWKEAGQLANVSISTVTRRMADQKFRERVRELRRQAVDRAVNAIADGLTDSVARLRLIVTDGEHEGNQLRAAVALLELALKYQDHGDLTERVTRLEEARRGGSPTP